MFVIHDTRTTFARPHKLAADNYVRRLIPYESFASTTKRFLEKKKAFVSFHTINVFMLDAIGIAVSSCALAIAWVQHGAIGEYNGLIR